MVLDLFRIRDGASGASLLAGFPLRLTEFRMYPDRVAYYDPAGTTSIKAYKGIGMEGAIAKWCAANTRRDLDGFKALARRVAGELSAGSSVFEASPGPGYFCIELAKLGDYEITGLDISKTFVEMAQRNPAGQCLEYAVWETILRFPAVPRGVHETSLLVAAQAGACGDSLLLRLVLLEDIRPAAVSL